MSSIVVFIVFIVNQRFPACYIAGISTNLGFLVFLSPDIPHNSNNNADHGQDNENDHDDKQSTVTFASSYTAITAGAAEC